MGWLARAEIFDPGEVFYGLVEDVSGRVASVPSDFATRPPCWRVPRMSI